MSFNNLLNQVFGSVKKSLEPNASKSTVDTITKVGGGAAAIGVLSMLLGKGGGSSLAKVGSLAALGGLAYQAYQNYQNNHQGSTQNNKLLAHDFDPSGQIGEEASKIILRTMIAAAAIDGMIDEQEKQLIISESGDSPDIQQWLLEEMRQPATIEQIAQQVGSNTALAAEVYLAARMVCARLARKEIVFLAQLSQILNLDEKLVEQLEKQAGFE